MKGLVAEWKIILDPVTETGLWYLFTGQAFIRN